MDTTNLPENIQQAIDLIVAVLRRMKEKRLANSGISCFNTVSRKESPISE